MRLEDNDRWEQGSEFDFPNCAGSGPSGAPWSEEGRMFASGRDAFHALLLHGQAARGWKRFLVPTYYCQQVVSSFCRSGIEIVLYPDSPVEPAPMLDALDARSGDALLVVHYFGLGRRPDDAAYVRLRRNGVEIIEDHSHDPWSGWARESKADWCVASLRKALPLPDGAALWSPVRHALCPQPSPTPLREGASAKKLTGMLLKRLYLDGRAVAKEDFRPLMAEAEDSLRAGDASGMTTWSTTLLSLLPLQAMREARKANFSSMNEFLAGARGLVLLKSTAGCPFSCVLLFDTPALRDEVKAGLLAARIYPAVLWPLEKPMFAGIPREHLDLSRRLLSLHCDARYDTSDMARVAGLLHNLVNASRTGPT